jgi:hypothetical protein
MDSGAGIADRDIRGKNDFLSGQRSVTILLNFNNSVI